MRINVLLVILMPLFFLACNNKSTFSFQNPQNVNRPDEVIVFNKSELQQISGFEENKYPLFKSEDNLLVPYQLDDMDNDGIWDEVALLLDFSPNEIREIEVDWVWNENELPEFYKRTNLRLGIIQQDSSYREVDFYEAPLCDDGFEVIAQGEGVNWENDKIGFRNYFD